MKQCPRCSSSKIVKTSDNFDWFECSKCEKRFKIRSLDSVAEKVFQEFESNMYNLMRGSPSPLPCLVRVIEGNVLMVEELKVTEHELEIFYKGATSRRSRSFSRDRFDVKDSGVSRRKLMSKNLNELFGYKESYRCRVCNNPLDDGRKAYCSDFCRQNAYEFQRKYTWSLIREEVIERDEGCVVCGSEEYLEVDHIVPVSEGGSYHDPSNLQTLCQEHHKKKSKENGDYSA